MVQFHVPIPVAPAPIGGERFAGQIRREQSFAARFDNGQAAQPFEQLALALRGDGIDASGLPCASMGGQNKNLAKAHRAFLARFLISYRPMSNDQRLTT
jgi:hypothetical protein